MYPRIWSAVAGKKIKDRVSLRNGTGLNVPHSSHSRRHCFRPAL
jgi:hypothetical protein